MKIIFLCRSLLISLIFVTSIWPNLVYADYLGSDNVRVFPASTSDIADGYNNGDVVQFIIEAVPRDTGSTEGHAAWSTFYIPPGVTVIGASYIVLDGSGNYVDGPAEDVDATYDGWGVRGAKGYGAGLGEGYVNEVQQDTGIFYSTDPRTALVKASVGMVNATGVPASLVYNQWDFDQTKAFGEAGAVSGNDGTGNTPILLGATNAGIGSPVAGPDAYYTNDYNPANVGSEYANVGPWQRIEVPNDKIGGSGPVTPATAQGAILNTAVDATGGYQLSSSNPLPAAANALRIVHGARRLGDIERWSVTLRIDDAAAFTAELDSGEVCAESIPGDTSTVAAKDNNWRYHEVSRSCVNLNSEALLVKEITNPVSAAAVQDGQAIVYQFTFTNLSAAPLANVVATDAEIANLDLQNEGVAGCPANYDGVISTGGTVSFTGIGGGVATWSSIPSLAAGASVTYTVCGTANGNFGDRVDNEARINYDGCLTGTDPCLTSLATVPISNVISGTVYNDVDVSGDLTAGDQGIEGVTVQLYVDNNGDGKLDGGDTLYWTETTASSGYYQFTSIPSDDYIIVETQPTGYSNTGDVDNTPLDCTETATNNGCDTIGGGSPGTPSSITVTAATNLLERDFFERLDAPDLQITKTASPDPVRQGNTLTYTLTITNNGNLAANNAQVTDTLPGGVTWVSTANSNIGTQCTDDAVLDCNCSEPDGTEPDGMICEMGSIAAGATETVTITVTVD